MFPVRAGPGRDASQAQRQPRRGVVRVLTKDGQLEERQVLIGVSNRVQMQVLSGLEEGEQVVVGARLPASATTRPSPNAQGPRPPGMPMMGPPPGGR